MTTVAAGLLILRAIVMLALGVAAALATLVLRRPTPAPPGAARGEGEPLCRTI